MLVIKAKENATIDVIESSFSLGARDTIKIIVEDEILKQYIKAINTYTTLDKYNLYTYGKFSNTKDIDKADININKDSSVAIVSGYGINYSRCLCCESKSDLGLGYCNLKADNNTKIGTRYIFSCYVNNVEHSNVNLILKDGTEQIKVIEINKNTKGWQQYNFDFVAKSSNFSVLVNIPGEGKCYIDNIQLFDSKDEIVENYYDTINFEVDIINPYCNNVSFTEVINYSKPDSEETFVTLFVPPITNVDIQNNILCKLKVKYTQKPKIKYLGNSEYNPTKSYIYISDPFILNGYILPPDSDRYELVVGQV